LENLCEPLAHSQLGTLGRVKSFLRGAQIFSNTANTFSMGRKIFREVDAPVPPSYRPGVPPFEKDCCDVSRSSKDVNFAKKQYEMGLEAFPVLVFVFLHLV